MSELTGIEAVVERFRTMTEDGKVTFREVIEFVYRAAGDVVRLAESLPSDGAEKKAVAMKALEHFIDTVITPLDLAGVPNLIEPLVDRGLKQFLLLSADASIDAIVAMFNQGGWLK